MWEPNLGHCRSSQCSSLLHHLSSLDITVYTWKLQWAFHSSLALAYAFFRPVVFLNCLARVSFPINSEVSKFTFIKELSLTVISPGHCDHMSLLLIPFPSSRVLHFYKLYLILNGLLLLSLWDCNLHDITFHMWFLLPIRFRLVLAHCSTCKL